jgi:hypothetical protein
VSTSTKNTESGSLAGPDEEPPEIQREKPGWPSHGTRTCDGVNPLTGRACISGYHQGYHRDASGAEWLDE